MNINNYCPYPELILDLPHLCFDPFSSYKVHSFLRKGTHFVFTPSHLKDIHALCLVSHSESIYVILASPSHPSSENIYIYFDLKSIHL